MSSSNRDSGRLGEYEEDDFGEEEEEEDEGGNHGGGRGGGGGGIGRPSERGGGGNVRRRNKVGRENGWMDGGCDIYRVGPCVGKESELRGDILGRVSSSPIGDKAVLFCL